MRLGKFLISLKAVVFATMICCFGAFSQEFIYAEDGGGSDETYVSVGMDSQNNSLRDDYKADDRSDDLDDQVDDGNVEIDGVKYQYDEATDKYNVSGYTGERSDVVIKSSVNGKKVTIINDEAFSGNTKMQTVSLPDSLVGIGSDAFRGCTNIKKIEIPKSVKWLGYDVFGGCKKLYQIVFSDNIIDIDGGCFSKYSNDSLTIIAPKNSYVYQYALLNGLKVSDSTKKAIRVSRLYGFEGEYLYIDCLNSETAAKFEISNKSVLNVDKYGNVHLKKCGNAKVTVKMDGITKLYNFKVVKRTQKNVESIIYKYYVTKNMTDYEKVVAANNFLVEYVKYDYDVYGKDADLMVIHTAKGALQNGLAVCDGYSHAFETIMNHYGIENKYITGASMTESHGWNLVKINSKWYHVDVTWNDIDNGDHRGIVASDEFLLRTDTQMGGHYWDKKKYPKANSKSIDKNYTHTGIYGAKLNRRTATIKNGKTVSFKVTGTKKTVTFTSDDKSIATVNSKGLVKGIKAGKTSIRIKIGDKSYVCEVTVK